MTLPHNIYLSRREDIDKKIDLILPKNCMIVLLNAPPFSGKDELSDILCESYPEMFNRLEFKFKIKELFMTIFNVSEELFNIVSRSENKDKPFEELNGLSYRNCMKMIPELMIKPNLGQTYFTEAIIPRFDPTKINLVTDNGFQEAELNVFEDRIETHNLKLALVKIIREGCNYDNDSRQETFLNHPKGLSLSIENPYKGDPKTAAFHRSKYTMRVMEIADQLFEFFEFYPDDQFSQFSRT